MIMNIRQQSSVKSEWKQWDTIPETHEPVANREAGMRKAHELADKNNAEVRVTFDDGTNGTYISPTPKVTAPAPQPDENLELLKALLVDLEALNHAGVLDKYVGIQARLEELRNVVGKQ